MSTDNSAATQESGELNIDSAAEAFTTLLEGASDEPVVEVDTEVDPPKEADPEPEAEDNAAEEGDDAPITLEVDGKQVTLTKAQLADAYKNGLRQDDYTRKTMAAADERKAAEAEKSKALQERQAYAQNLTKMAAQLEGAIQQQGQIDWEALLKTDPIQYLEQKANLEKRQSALQQNLSEQSRLAQLSQAEQAEASRNHLASQQQELLAKLPQWKDDATASKERDAIKNDLLTRGYTAQEVSNITDHKAVVMAREAMLYRQMMAKANAAAKKIQATPEKVIRPGVSASTDAKPRLAGVPTRGSLSVEQAAKAFNSLI